MLHLEYREGEVRRKESGEDVGREGRRRDEDKGKCE